MAQSPARATATAKVRTRYERASANQGPWGALMTREKEGTEQGGTPARSSQGSVEWGREARRRGDGGPGLPLLVLAGPCQSEGGREP